jgi:FAD/FMN-containing dehydrogenase
MVCQAATFTGLNENDKRWSNWSEDVEFRASEYFEPSHSAPDVNDGLQQLVHVVGRATAERHPLHAIGAGWSFEDVAASDEWVVSLRCLDRVLPYVTGPGGDALTDDWRQRQSDSKSATRLIHVEAGVRIATLCEQLDAQGLAMPTLGGANGQVLAGVVSTSTHGGDWQQPPFPDLVRAIHLIGEGGKELWIERKSLPITVDDRLTTRLPCRDTEIIRDDDVFDAATVACGRFGIVYAYVLEVRRSFRVVEVVTNPSRDAALQALRDGIEKGNGLSDLFDLLGSSQVPAGLDDATGTPYFVQLLFNSQDPSDLWAHRRWETTVEASIPVDGQHITARSTSHDLAVAIVAAANVALLAAANVAAIAGLGLVALYLTGLTVYFNSLVTRRDFVLGSVVAAVLDTLWKVPVVAALVPRINHMVLDDRFKTAVRDGRRGPHYLLTAGTRAESDNSDYKGISIEVVFDATVPAYLDFLDDILGIAPSFQQAGYISVRYSRRSHSLLSMHNVSGDQAVSIEVASLKGLPGNDAWMRYVHDVAVRRNGRPHWGQYNRLDELSVITLYAAHLNSWREALLRVNGPSMTFSNRFTRGRGLEPQGIAREVTAVKREGRLRRITHLCAEGADWSPVPASLAIQQIESGAVQYFTRAGTLTSPIGVVQGRTGRYLRSRADAGVADNLDRLPECSDA